MRFKCVHVKRDRYSIGSEYYIEDTESGKISVIPKEELKAKMKNGLQVENLKLSKDFRVIMNRNYADSYFSPLEQRQWMA